MRKSDKPLKGMPMAINNLITSSELGGTKVADPRQSDLELWTGVCHCQCQETVSVAN